MQTTRTPSWPRASGSPLLSARIRTTPDDFQVTEILGFDPDGEGEHDFLLVEKSGANTAWVARQLARHAGTRLADVGYAGRKDRHAVTRQWFSVPARGTDWRAFTSEGVRVLEHRPHGRKLRRGSHRGNRFRIALRSERVPVLAAEILKRLDRITVDGVPNYFGEQRFGRDGNNLDLAERLFAGARMKRERRGIAISAARSFLFNEILAARVGDGSWNRILPGELANLDGSGSVFAVERPDTDLQTRCRDMDIHPTGALHGQGLAPGGDVAVLEAAVLDEYSTFRKGLEKLGARRAQRPLRLRVCDLHWQVVDNAIWLEFELPSGGFATSVLREVADCQSERSNT